MGWVAVLMGSSSDWPVMQSTTEILSDFDIHYEVRVTSAHRNPAQTADYVRSAESRGCQIFICAAGLAAHLAGAVAANTTKPVIGVPMDGGPMSGFDALLSTVQMPGGIPVATLAIGKAGAKNAGHLAAQILALSDDDLQQQLKRDRERSVKRVGEQNASIQNE